MYRGTLQGSEGFPSGVPAKNDRTHMSIHPFFDERELAMVKLFYFPSLENIQFSKRRLNLLSFSAES